MLQKPRSLKTQLSAPEKRETAAAPAGAGRRPAKHDITDITVPAMPRPLGGN
jgi:hypothetical protein